MAEVKHTPGPWIYYADLPSDDPNWHIVTTANKLRVLANVHIEPGNRMDEANARLFAAAPDHAAIAAALCSGIAQWDRTEFCVGGIRHSTKLDEFGVPVMTHGMRAALSKATVQQEGR